MKKYEKPKLIKIKKENKSIEKKQACRCSGGSTHQKM